MNTEDAHEVDVVIVGGGTAGSNAARAAVKAGAGRVILVHTKELLNTCIEEGCMPSKSILAAAKSGKPLQRVLAERDQHIERLLRALFEGFEGAGFEVVSGNAEVSDPQTVVVTHDNGSTTYTTKSIVIATGSRPFVPPIPGLQDIGDALLVSDDIVARRAHFNSVPKRILTIGGGPIGLELSTFFHDMGAKARVLQRRGALSLFDPEFGDERVRASQDIKSFPIFLNAELTRIKKTDTGLRATITYDSETKEEEYDAILIAAGRMPNLDGLGLVAAGVTLDTHGNVILNEHLQSNVASIFFAGDVVGHHQILHIAAAMGKVAGHNAASPDNLHAMDYDKEMMAVSFDQFPSALIGLTETEARKRGIDVVTATRHFNSIGLGILKRQEYGMWKLVADRSTGKIVGSQILGPESTGELIQLLTPVIHAGMTYGDLLSMPWYHPTFAEILLSLARDLCKKEPQWCPKM